MMVHTRRTPARDEGAPDDPPAGSPTSKRKAKQRDEEETLEAAPAETPAPVGRSTRSTVHIDDDGPSVTPRSEHVDLVESE